MDTSVHNLANSRSVNYMVKVMKTIYLAISEVERKVVNLRFEGTLQIKPLGLWKMQESIANLINSKTNQLKPPGFGGINAYILIKGENSKKQLI